MSEFIGLVDLNKKPIKLLIPETDSQKQAFNFKHDDNTYTILYNGKLYNTKDISTKLIELGYTFERIF